MSVGDSIEADGKVVEVLPNGQFRVELDNGHTILAYTAGKMRKFQIKIVLHDRVRVALSEYDLTRGRVIFRTK